MKSVCYLRTPYLRGPYKCLDYTLTYVRIINHFNKLTGAAESDLIQCGTVCLIIQQLKPVLGSISVITASYNKLNYVESSYLRALTYLEEIIFTEAYGTIVNLNARFLRWSI